MPFNSAYTYDHNGNRLTQTQNGNLTQSFGYDAHDKLVSGLGESESYDANGNLTSQTVNGQRTSYTYDDEDRLTSITLPDGHTDSFSYNGLGMRLSKSDPTGNYWYYTDGVSPASDVVSNGYSTFTPGISETTGAAGGGYASIFYLADASGNSRGLLNGSGSATDGYNWDAFGTLMSRFGSNPTGFAWNVDDGYQTDNDDGLTLLGYRYYDSRIGRFISQDPAGDGDNWYAYAGNDPVDETDPSGLFQTPEQQTADAWLAYTSSDYSGQKISYDSWGGAQFTAADGTVENFLSPSDSMFSPQSAGDPQASGGPSMLQDIGSGFAVSGAAVASVGINFGLYDGGAARHDPSFATSAALAGVGETVASFATGGGEAKTLEELATGCFTKGTPVQTQGKPREIQDIRAGDFVATRNLQTNQTEYRKVTRTFQHLAHDTITVEFADAKTGKVVDTVTATPEHPFYVPGQGMAALGSLGIGTQVVTRAGPAVVVHSLVRHTSAAGVAVYNIEVEGDHTYFVGNNGEWVHNLCDGDEQALIDLAKEYSRLPVRRPGNPFISSGEADTLWQWAKEYGVKALHGEKAGTWDPFRTGTGIPHIDIGPIHVPVPPGWTP